MALYCCRISAVNMPNVSSTSAGGTLALLSNLLETQLLKCVSTGLRKGERSKTKSKTKFEMNKPPRSPECVRVCVFVCMFMCGE